jgi:hypothetical protein
MRQRLSSGVLLAWGTTNWTLLSAYCQGDQTCLNTMSASAPIGAQDSGFVWGLKLGYQLEENFGIEATYRRFHETIINFGRWSFYDALPPDTPSQIASSVYAYSLMGKFFAPISSSHFYVYASAGPTVTHRKDILTDRSHVNLSFGLGLGRIFFDSLQAEIAFFYATGFDHSTITPAESYTPFLLSLGIELSYRF